MFVCAENAGRSQIAEAFFNYYAKKKGTNWIAESSGTFPANKVNPVVLEAMAEKGIDLGNTKPKQFAHDKADEHARIISFGCLVKSSFSKEIQIRIEDWHVDDPKDQPIDKVREIRDELEGKITTLIDSLPA